MPTPVSVARQCLTDEAARALDEAVAVARRRSHTQTTSLHAVSALLALPSSALRDACTRARDSAYSSRNQFRALDLWVGVSLDRLPSSKNLEEEPPISNSLMAAIKRSQANQRRHPDNFHLQQIHYNQQTPSVLKVEVKHFILSILDDPIVSRVFWEAGFKSSDIKLAIIQPPLMMHHHTSKFSRTGYPPTFLCNFPGSDSGLSRPGFSFPFNTGDDLNDSDWKKKIGEVLANASGKGKNPLLVGFYANDALQRFVEYVNRNEGGVLPDEIAGLSVICIEKEVSEFVCGGESGKEKMGLRFEEVGEKLERCSGPGIVVNFGELKVLVGGEVCSDAVKYLVSKLSALLEGFRERLWLIGAATSYDTYLKFLGRFPSVDKDWDLRLLPITSKSSATDATGSKSSLMGSFVPLGGFFSTPFDFKNPLGSINQSITRCHLCTAKYEQDAAALLKKGSASTVADKYSENFPSWLQTIELDRRKEVAAAKTKDDGTTLNTNILELQKKWNDNCQRLHHALPLSKFDISQASVDEDFQCAMDRKENSSSYSRDSSLSESQCANPRLSVHMDLQKTFLTKHSMPMPVASEAQNINFQSKLLEDVSKSQLKERENPWFAPHSRPNAGLPTDCTSSSPVTSVTTDLGLGTLYASSTRELNAPKLRDQLLPCSHSVEFDVIREHTSRQVAQSSSCSRPSGRQFDLKDHKSISRALAEKVGWQDGAIFTISDAVSHCKAGYGRHRGSYAKGDIWLAFLGPDKIGKQKIALALAEIMFGSSKSLISVDMSSHDSFGPFNSTFECQELSDYNAKLRGNPVVDYIAAELSKKPHSVIFLENVDKADTLAQSTLSQAMRTGKFPDSHRRPISINNTIFVATSTTSMGNISLQSETGSRQFSEKKILRAKSWQMQILVEHVLEGASKSNEMKVRVLRNITSKACVNKRKLAKTSDSKDQEISPEAKKRTHKTQRSYLDLNLPIEEMEEKEENIDCGECESDSISENTQAWLEDFFDQADEKVEFKPFDFDALAEKLVEEISIQFQRVFRPEVLLEIDHEVMVQILAASWLSDRKRAVEDWIENVLGRGFNEAQLKYQLGVQSVVKLVACKGILVEEQAPGVCLPSKVNL